MIKSKAGEKIKNIFKLIGKYAIRWLYVVALIAGAAYGFWVWNKFVLNASWSEEKKNSYVQEQAVFSFDKKSYAQVQDSLKMKKERFDGQAKYSGWDLFYPEGF